MNRIGTDLPLTKNLDNWICISWTEPTERFWKAATRIKLYCSIPCSLDWHHDVRFFDW